MSVIDGEEAVALHIFPQLEDSAVASALLPKAALVGRFGPGVVRGLIVILRCMKRGTGVQNSNGFDQQVGPDLGTFIA